MLHKLQEQDGHETHGTEPGPWGGLDIYINWERKRKRKSDCIYCSTLTLLTVSENVLEGWRSKEHEISVNWRTQKCSQQRDEKEMEMNQQWQVKSTADQTAEIRVAGFALTGLWDSGQSLKISKPQPSHLWSGHTASTSRRILQDKRCQPLFTKWLLAKLWLITIITITIRTIIRIEYLLEKPGRKNIWLLEFSFDLLHAKEWCY